MHGDYRLDNVLVVGPDDRIAAVLDWEMATLGDPLTDLGLLAGVHTDGLPGDTDDGDAAGRPAAVDVPGHPTGPS